jgi:hypothetical protein
VHSFEKGVDMKRRLNFCLVILILGISVGSTVHAETKYIFITIDVPGAASTWASGINDFGAIVG